MLHHTMACRRSEKAEYQQPPVFSPHTGAGSQLGMVLSNPGLFMTCTAHQLLYWTEAQNGVCSAVKLNDSPQTSACRAAAPGPLRLHLTPLTPQSKSRGALAHHMANAIAQAAAKQAQQGPRLSVRHCC